MALPVAPYIITYTTPLKSLDYRSYDDTILPLQLGDQMGISLQALGLVVSGLHCGYIEIMDNKMETTNYYLGFRVRVALGLYWDNGK